MHGIVDGLPDRSLLRVVTNVYHLFWQFKHSSDFKAFKRKKMQKNSIQDSQARFCAYNAQAQN